MRTKLTENHCRIPRTPGLSVSLLWSHSHCEHTAKTDTRQYSTASRDRHSLRDRYSGIHTVPAVVGCISRQYVLYLENYSTCRSQAWRVLWMWELFGGF